MKKGFAMPSPEGVIAELTLEYFASPQSTRLFDQTAFQLVLERALKAYTGKPVAETCEEDSRPNHGPIEPHVNTPNPVYGEPLRNAHNEFTDWWILDGSYLDPDSDVSWHDKRHELAQYAYAAGRLSGQALPVWQSRYYHHSLAGWTKWTDAGEYGIHHDIQNAKIAKCKVETRLIYRPSLAEEPPKNGEAALSAPLGDEPVVLDAKDYGAIGARVGLSSRTVIEVDIALQKIRRDAAASRPPKEVPWISVEDRLPDDFEEVLFVDLKGCRRVGHTLLREDGRIWNFGGTSAHQTVHDFGIVAWQPLPSRPSEGGKEWAGVHLAGDKPEAESSSSPVRTSERKE